MIKKFEINNFQNFQKIAISQCGNINLIIGENDTGKTGLMKLLYATVQAWEIYSKKQSYDRTSFKKVLGDKLFNTFQPRRTGIGDLVTKGSKAKLQTGIELCKQDGECQSLRFAFGENTKKTINECTADEKIALAPDDFHSVFIPAKEVLTAFRTIEYTRKQFLPGFDDTYLDLIRDLNVDVRTEPVSSEFEKISRQLEKLFPGTIEQTEKPERFIFKKGNKQFEMPLTAEGVKRIGILTTLIKNWQLRKGSVLFMDEPDSNLHPKAIYQLVHRLVALSQCDVQLFISTHNYFVIKTLELIARKQDIPINCISITVDDDINNSTVHNLRNGMPENPIIDVALTLFDKELEI